MPPKSGRKGRGKKEPAAKRRLDLDPKTPPRPKRGDEDDDAAVVVDLTGTPAKKRDFFGTQEKQTALVTPEKESAAPREHKRRKVEQKQDEYVPTYIHKTVEYKRKGETKDETQVATFKLVEKHFVIPDDFENNRKYGPLSGVSFEERAIAAYSCGLLEPKTQESVAICSACAQEGHKRSACPQLV